MVRSFSCFKAWWFGLPVITLVSFLPRPAIAASFYSITDLGTLDPSNLSSSYANGINETGQVVGYFTIPNGTNPDGTKREIKRAFTWQDANQNGISDPGEMQLLTPLSTRNGRDSVAEELNALGQVVGYSLDGSGRRRAVLWQNGTVIDLGTLGGDSAQANAINDLGKIVGYAKNSDGYDRATAWNPATGGAIEISQLGKECQALDVNNLGNAAGMCSNLLDVYSLALFGSSYIKNVLTGINDQNQTVGWAALQGNKTRAFWWQPGVSSNIVLDAASDTSTKANELNNQGEIVGEATRQNQQFAALWDRPQATLANLNDRTSAHCGWNLQSAQDINNKGQIVGHGIVNGQTHAFLLNPYTSFDLTFGLNSNTIYEGQKASATLATQAPGCSFLQAGDPTFTITDQTRTLFSGTQTNMDLSPFEDEGVFYLTAQAKDTKGVPSNWMRQTLTVLNVAPTIQTPLSDLTVAIGQLFNLSAQATDPGITDILTYQWDLNGDGDYETTGQLGQPISHHFDAAGLYQIGLQVSDGDGGFDYGSFNVTVGESAAVPEPTSTLGVMGAAILGWLNRRKR